VASPRFSDEEPDFDVTGDASLDARRYIICIFIRAVSFQATPALPLSSYNSPFPMLLYSLLLAVRHSSYDSIVLVRDSPGDAPTESVTMVCFD